MDFSDDWLNLKCLHTDTPRYENIKFIKAIS